MACAVERMTPHLGQERADQRGEHCGVASVQAAKEPERAPEQGAERQELTGSPDKGEDAGASSGESNTQKVELHGEAGRYHCRALEAADPSRLAPSGHSGKGETDEKAPGAKDGKSCKLPRPEGSSPCPRCDSMDTKFCYYNNYNVKQPRYFCKGCQRYWTAGGTLRNVPVGAGRRKNKSSAAKEAVREQARKASCKESSMDTSFLAFPGMVDPALSAYGPGPMAPGKAGIPGFVPNLAVPAQLSPLALQPYPTVDPAAASALQGCLAAAFDGSVPQPSFGVTSLGPSLSNQRGASDLDEDRSHGGRRVRPRRAESEAAPADSAPNDSALYGSNSTVTDLRTLANSAHGSTLNGSGASLRGGPDSTHSHHHSQLQSVPGDSNLGSSFQPFYSASAHGTGSGFAKMPVGSTGMQPDWISMAAAAGQQQAVAAQHQLQYQAAAMQAQAMHAAAANAAWNQSNNPYLSGLCFPYNLYGAAAPQQLYAAYASLAPQASPWGAMDGATAGALGAPTLNSGQAGSNPVSAPVPTSQPSLLNWGISGSGVSPGDSSSHHAQQWMPSSGRGHPGSQNGAREMAGAWQQWPAHVGELALAADNKVRASKGHKYGGQGMPSGLHASTNGSILSGTSGNSSLTADLHNGVHRPAPSFNTSA